MTWILQSATTLTIDLDLATLCEDLTIWQTGDNGKRNLVLARIWQGSILPRPLTYNLGLKSLRNPLPKGTLCGKYDPEWAKGRDKNHTQICYDQHLLPFFQKQWILKNTMWVKYWPDWSKARKKICSRQRCTKRSAMTFTSHQNICFKAKTVNLLPVTQRSASEQWIFNFKLCKILAYDIASTSNI